MPIKKLIPKNARRSSTDTVKSMTPFYERTSERECKESGRRWESEIVIMDRFNQTIVKFVDMSTNSYLVFSLVDGQNGRE